MDQPATALDQFGRLRHWCEGPACTEHRSFAEGIASFPSLRNVQEGNDHVSHLPCSVVGVWSGRPVFSLAVRLPSDPWLPFLPGRDRPRSGTEPTRRALAGESACPVFRAGLRTALYAARSRSRAGGPRFTYVPAGAGAHRRAAADPLWHRAHRTGADPLVVPGPPRSGEARPHCLVALPTYRHRLWGRVVGLSYPPPCFTPGVCRSQGPSF